MADYPSGVYSPRTKANRAGVVYTPANTTVGYVEDVTKLDAEVVAIETELGATPKGASASVAARLTAIEGSISALIPPKLVKGSGGGQQNIDSGTTRYFRIHGNFGVETTEALANIRFPFAVTAKKLWIYVSANSHNGDAVFTLRDDGSDTALTLTVGSAQTGTFTDDVHSVNIAANSLLSLKCVAGGSAGAVGLNLFSFEFDLA
jgi:hypothetical protein